MTNSVKAKIVGFIASASMLAVAVPAFAANLDGQAIFPGNQNQVWENPNDSVSIRLVLEAETGEVIHAVEFNFIDGGNLSSVCKDISNFEGAQDRTVTTSVNVPPNTGDYGMEINVFHTDTMQEANARTGSAACQGDNDSVYNEGNVVHVVPNGSSNNSNNNDGNTSGNSDEEIPSWLAALLAALGIGGTNTPAPTVSPKCAELNAKLVGTVDNTYNDANVRLQGFLLSEGASIPALKAGASFGYKGDQTRAAVSWFKTTNQCI